MTAKGSDDRLCNPLVARSDEGVEVIVVYEGAWKGMSVDTDCCDVDGCDTGKEGCDTMG